MGIAVDQAGTAYVVGQTRSRNFPTRGALMPTYNGGFNEAFFAKIKNSGASFDFDGDARSDVSVFRPSNASWFYLRSSNNALADVQFGVGTDRLAPADFDGDGRTDISVFRSGNWFILQSSNNQFRAVQFGSSGDLPRPADFDGDGRADISVFRPSTGSWYRLNSANNSFFAVQFGAQNDQPVPAAFLSQQ